MFWFLKKRVTSQAQLPSAEVEPARYEGRPLLVILENYVLDCIGALPLDKQQEVAAVVQRVWGGTDWKASVRRELELPDSLDDHVRELWRRTREIDRQNGTELHFVQFAKMYVDANFARLIDKNAVTSCPLAPARATIAGR